MADIAGARLDQRPARRRRRALLLLPAVLVAASLGAIPDAGAAIEVRLVAAADFNARAATETVLARMASLRPDAALAVGDLGYRDLPTEYDWCGFVKRQVGEGFPFELVSGNHESLDVHDGDINDYSACLPNQVPRIVGTYGREYYMDLPSGSPLVRVIMASPGLTFEDGTWLYQRGTSHYAWLEAAIDGGRAAGARWIVVGAHIPCFSVGVYNCPTSRDFYDLLLSKRVDLMVHGHEHGYMRTHQLRDGVAGCPTVPSGTFDADCVADSDNAYVAGAGTVFAGVGTGGGPLRDVNPADPEAGYFAEFSGLNLDATHGLLDVRATETRLAAEFVPTSGAGMTDSFVIEVGPAPDNQAPVARISSATSGLTVTVDGSASTDADGTIVAHAWDFGDGATATGATPAAHTYPREGTYRVTLTVTDDDGATGTTSRDVTVAEQPPVTTIARDTFTRTASQGWGTAEVGGAWTTSPSSALSVSSGKGRIANAAGSGRTAYLRSVSSSASDLTLTLSPDKLTTGGGLYVSVAGRWVSGAGEYRAKARLRSDGRVELSLVRTTATGAETTLRSAVVVPQATYSAGGTISVRVQVTGTSPTTIRARAWMSGTAEPTTWLVTTTDSTAALQVPGGVGLMAYLSSSATNAPITLAVDDVIAVRP